MRGALAPAGNILSVIQVCRIAKNLDNELVPQETRGTTS
jgi:hypothetical protein